MKIKFRLNRLDVLAYLFLTVLGFTICYIAITRPSIPIMSVLVNIGAGLISVSLLFFFYAAFSIDPTSKLKEIIEKSPTLVKSGTTYGVEQFFSKRGDVTNTDWLKLLYGAKKDLSILAVAMQTNAAVHDFPDRMLALKNKGVNVRILLMHPESSDTEQRLRMDDPQGYGSVEQYINRTIDRLNPKLSGKEIVRLHKLAHTCDVTWADDTMFFVPYLAAGPGGTSPCIKVSKKEGGYYERFREHFNALWEDEYTETLESFLARKQNQ
jgi:hypothetical protein